MTRCTVFFMSTETCPLHRCQNHHHNHSPHHHHQSTDTQITRGARDVRRSAETEGTSPGEAPWCPAGARGAGSSHGRVRGCRGSSPGGAAWRRQRRFHHRLFPPSREPQAEGGGGGGEGEEAGVGGDGEARDACAGTGSAMEGRRAAQLARSLGGCSSSGPEGLTLRALVVDSGSGMCKAGFGVFFSLRCDPSCSRQASDARHHGQYETEGQLFVETVINILVVAQRQFPLVLTVEKTIVSPAAVHGQGDR